MQSYPNHKSNPAVTQTPTQTITEPVTYLLTYSLIVSCVLTIIDRTECRPVFADSYTSFVTVGCQFLDPTLLDDPRAPPPLQGQMWG